MDLTHSTNNLDRVLDLKLKKKYFQQGQAYYMVREASRVHARCIYIYRTEFGHITKPVGDFSKMKESTREEFTDALVQLLTDLDEMVKWIV